jgi:hypothetical protein
MWILAYLQDRNLKNREKLKKFNGKRHGEPFLPVDLKKQSITFSCPEEPFTKHELGFTKRKTE